MRHYAMAADDGRIMQIYSTSRRMIPCDEGIDDTTHFVTETGQILPRTEYRVEPLANGLIITLQGLPEGVHVETNGRNAFSDGGEVVIEYDLPGTYVISLNGRVDYIDKTLEVTVGDDA